MSWKPDKDKQRPSVSGKRVASRRGGNGDLAASDGAGNIRVQMDGALFSETGTQRFDHVDVPIDDLLKDRQAAFDAAPASGSHDAESCPSPESRGDASAFAPSDEGAPFGHRDDSLEADASAADGEEAPKPFNASEALAAFAAASAREVPIPKKRKRIPASLFAKLKPVGEGDAEDAQAENEDASVHALEACAAQGQALAEPAVRFDSASPVQDACPGASDDAVHDGPASATFELDDSDIRELRARARHAASAGAPASDTASVADGRKPAHLQGERAAGLSEAASYAEQDSPERQSAIGDQDGSACIQADADSAESSGGSQLEAAADEVPDDSPKHPDRPSVKGNRLLSLLSKVHARQVAIIAAVLAGMLAIGVAVSCLVFGAHLSKSITLEDDDLSQVLVPAESRKDPFYTLVAVEYARTSRYYEGPELLALVRIDPQANVATIISIPASTQVSLTDSSYHPISEAQVVGGDAYLVSTVSQLMNVSISHFVRIDDVGLASIVDRFGGIEVDVPRDVDDSDVGDVTVPKGKQTLDGKSVVALTRADNYEEDPVGVQSANQLNVVSALLAKCVESSGMGYVDTAGDLKNDFKTDMTGPKLKSALRSLADGEGYKTYTAVLPGELDVSSGGYEYSRDKTETRLMMDAVNGNGNPEDRDESKVDKASVFIEVQNGTTIVGGAAELREILREKGWNVSFIGNNPDEDTPQTLVIYDDEEMKAAAEEVVADLGLGKAIKGDGEKYQFGTDLLVVLGLDWDKDGQDSGEGQDKDVE